MRPRPFSRGNAVAGITEVIRGCRFNEAATFQSRKYEPFRPSMFAHCSCFNEAATFQSRKYRQG